MLIDHIFPAVVAEKSTLQNRLLAEATANSLSGEVFGSVITGVPERLINAGCFLDKMTGLWRYEFGVPYSIEKSHVWGTHMWVPVSKLFAALYCAKTRLADGKRTDYLARLADPERHQAVLVEMIPPHKIDPAIPLEFEVAGFGAGNHTIDWVIRPEEDRIVLLDVKRRTTDFIQQAEEMAADSSSQEPTHDPSLLFRSVEQKFVAANPDNQLQGVWIYTDIKQNEERLLFAFSALCVSRVHFVILGDWRSDAYVLSRRPEDRQFLLDLFRLKSSTRFTFRTENEG
ncbi:hypothetical protein [Methylocaldum sp.]|uniref:hypothetical protein n=1 Tax=Methylocaldum sp. TaxID=1969727 RepID=UPI002D60E0B8|nr:hypothetical protein [Methylocaldum sp.]HYE36668.1 hypothetical protein [Methylocaldum sp.]